MLPDEVERDMRERLDLRDVFVTADEVRGNKARADLVGGALPVESMSMVFAPEPWTLARVEGYEIGALRDGSPEHDNFTSWSLLTSSDGEKLTNAELVLTVEYPALDRTDKVLFNLMRGGRNVTVLIQEAAAQSGEAMLGLTGVAKGKFEFTETVIVQVPIDDDAFRAAEVVEKMLREESDGRVHSDT